MPAVIILIAVATLVMSSYQKEAGIIEPGKGGRVTVAAAAEAQQDASGSGEAAYLTFAKALTVASSEADNMATTNPAETRLQTIVSNTLDCLRAEREVWGAELANDWDPAVDGSGGYWLTLHPALQTAPDGSALTTAQVRQWAHTSTQYWLQRALDLVQ